MQFWILESDGADFIFRFDIKILYLSMPRYSFWIVIVDLNNISYLRLWY